MDKPTPFRIIIIGGGPVGLYLAHALTRANIDYIVLERRPSVVSAYGSIICLWPQTLRLIDQIGLLEEVRQLATPFKAKKRVHGATGTVLAESWYPSFMERRHGYPFLTILRSDLLRILYENLKGRETRIRPSSEVVDIDTTSPTSVTVYLQNGSVETGSIVIGADGVHSMVRTKMLQLLADANPNPIPTSNPSSPNPNLNPNPMIASHHGLIGRAPAHNLPSSIKEGTLFESRGTGTVVHSTVIGDTVHFVALSPVIHHQNPSPFPSKDQDQEKEIHRYIHSTLAPLTIFPGIRLADLLPTTPETTTTHDLRFIAQESGLLETPWHYGRIVLVGDAVHKTTSVNGLGLNCGLHSAVVLVNEVYALVHSKFYQAGKERERERGGEGDLGLGFGGSGLSLSLAPSTAELETAFTKYKSKRDFEVRVICWVGGWIIRETTAVAGLDSWRGWFWNRVRAPLMDLEFFARGLLLSVLLVREGQVLSFVPFRGKRGYVSWRHWVGMGVEGLCIWRRE
ncbi:hypothetical protein BJY04DRAFT_221957 [Aspergillus karnatakaensis]|uniref:FAD-dependent oxidoreductase n=1 Tax=Aspergillus karnatakaensis TaxID=1810916 RepID=UPI003CCD8685